METIGHIRSVQAGDEAQITSIYNHFIDNTIITFEEKHVELEEMKARIERLTRDYPYFVYVLDGRILGYAYAGPWKERSAYRFTVECSIYLAPQVHGKGIGKVLYSKLISGLKSQGYKCLIGGISLPNPASVGLHESLGFKHLGTFSKVGFKFDHWIDVAYYELHFI
jgi:phosphinothricin acetyltransferase